jgi:hypothetical protein
MIRSIPGFSGIFPKSPNPGLSKQGIDKLQSLKYDFVGFLSTRVQGGHV